MEQKGDGSIAAKGVSSQELKLLWYAPWFASSRGRYLGALPETKYVTKIITGSNHFDYEHDISSNVTVLPKTENFFQKIKNLLSIVKIVIEYKPNLILVDDLSGILQLCFFTLLSAKYPLAFAIDDVVNHDSQDRRSKRVQLLRSILIRSCRNVLTFSENSRRVAESMYPNVVVKSIPLISEVQPSNKIYNAADRENFALIGRWSEYKGFDLGLAIYAQFRKSQNTSSKLEVWCSGLEFANQDLPGVVWKSVKSYKWGDLIDALPKYRGVLLPYRSSTQSGVQVLAWDSGVPCVISNLPGLLENQPALKKGLELDDFDGWIEAMSNLESDDYLQEVVNAGKIAVKKSRSKYVVATLLDNAIETFLRTKNNERNQ